ncbi:MAG: TolC family protein [Gammaproteobacteria bacterium]
MRIDVRALAILLVTILTTSCASIPEDAGFGDVQTTVVERTGQHVQWDQDTDADRAAENAVQRMLSQPLNADEAAQIALLNNRGLRAVYEDLSLTQANLVQAGLLTNPIFSTAVGFPLDGGSVDLTFSIVQDFLSILYRPLRRQIARAQFQSTKLRVTEAVIELAAHVRGQFYDVQADSQRLEFLQQVVTATAASAELARRFYDAGNITELDLAREQALYQEARLALATAQTRLIQNRERLNALMGLWGEDTQWTIVPRLPELPMASKALPLQAADLEQRAIRANLGLGAARKEIRSAAGILGFTNATALVPFFEPGVDAEREESEWEIGPSLAFPIPIFNQGQARLAAARAQLRQAQQTYWAQAVEIRAAVRAARQTALSARNRARYVKDVLLPAYTRVVNNTQLQYNAMQVGAFQLLAAKQLQINAGLRYIGTLLEYWMARTALEQILNGSMADLEITPVAEIPQGGFPAISVM